MPSSSLISDIRLSSHRIKLILLGLVVFLYEVVLNYSIYGNIYHYTFNIVFFIPLQPSFKGQSTSSKYHGATSPPSMNYRIASNTILPEPDGTLYLASAKEDISVKPC